MKLKLRSSVRFLASILAGTGTAVRKDGLGTYIDLDYEDLESLSVFDPATKQFAVVDSISGEWNKTTLSDVLAVSGYVATSLTPITIGMGTATFTTQSGLAYRAGARVRASSQANTANYMEGLVTSYSGTTLVVSISRTSGSGSHSDWNLSLAGDPGAGDLLSTNNGSDFANLATTLNNLGGLSYSDTQTLTAPQKLKARTNAGLDTISTQAASAVAITGGTIFADVGMAWKVANLRADNVVGFESVGMDVTADYAILYNPTTKTTTRVFGSLLTKQCTISTAGPASGGRDQAAAFADTDTVWFYYIWGAVPGVGMTTSKTAPTVLNGGGTTGPVLPATYTHYAPCFPVLMVGSATLNPAIPQGGTTQIQVRGNKVNYPNVPEIIGAGYPTMNFDLSAWIPSVHTACHLMIDTEIHSSAGGAVIGGAIPSTTLGNFGNVSLYPPVASSWYAQNTHYSLPLPNQLMSITFASSSGVIDNALGEVWIDGYSFSNGGE